MFLDFVDMVRLSLVTVVAQGIMLCDGVRTHCPITAANVILILVCKAVLQVFAAHAVAGPEARFPMVLWLAMGT